MSHLVETRQQAIDDLKVIAIEMAKPPAPLPPFVHWVSKRRFRELVRQMMP